jgi:hypothetical protein
MSGSINNVDNLNFYTTSSAAGAVGRFVWNDGDGTLDLGLKGGNVTLEVGEQTFARVYNGEGTTLTKGEVVYISGSQGNRILVKRADYSAEAGSSNTLGFVAETIISGDEGFVITNGVFGKLNTVGLTGGSLLYLSSSGQYTETKTVAPQHTVILGYVERVHATVGSIYVKIDNGYELGELHNVLTNGATNGDLLAYSGSVWTHRKQLSGSYGITGSLQATSFTGSLQGSASFAINSSTASFLSGTVVSASYATTASFASSSPAVYDFGSFATPTDVGGGGNFGIVTDGDKGDITVTSSGSIWTIDNDAVTYAKIQNVTTSSVLLGRATTGAGNIEEIILGSGLTLSGSTLSAAGGGGGAQIQVDTFTTSSTWTKPAWAKYFRVYLVGGAGAGGSGARRATASARYGGGGGAPASSVWIELTNTEITGSSVSVTIGAGGISGSSVTTDDTNGNNGGNGGATSFGSFAATYAANGGSGGTTSAGSRGTSVSVISNYGPGSTIGGQNGSNTSPGTASGLSNQTLSYTGNFGGAGGAGAAGGSTTTATGGTFDYWSPILPSVAVSSGGTNGGDGNDGVSFTYGYFTVGTPGGGGSYKTGQATGRGGDASFGAGGGGGAASDNGFASGRGGNGGNGICIVVSIG